MWRAGCIIRSRFLGKIKEAFDRNPKLANLLLDPYFRRGRAAASRLAADGRRGGETASPFPAMSSALAYYDGYRCEPAAANLLQAQRDYFGAHTYERIDKPRGEFFHTNWTGARPGVPWDRILGDRSGQPLSLDQLAPLSFERRPGWLRPAHQAGPEDPLIPGLPSRPTCSTTRLIAQWTHDHAGARSRVTEAVRRGSRTAAKSTIVRAGVVTARPSSFMRWLGARSSDLRTMTPGKE